MQDILRLVESSPWRKEHCTMDLMKSSLILVSYLLLLLPSALSQRENEIPQKLARPKLTTLDQLELTRSQLQHIKNNRILVDSQLINLAEDSQQQWDFELNALHPKSCSHALRRLSRYETFSEFIGFIKVSEYDDSLERLHFIISSRLLPFDMRLSFQIERIQSAGVYLYHFDQGFLQGLKGEIHVSKYQQRCFFHSKVHWQGPHTGITPAVFNLFSSTLSRRFTEILFRISAQ